MKQHFVCERFIFDPEFPQSNNELNLTMPESVLKVFIEEMTKVMTSRFRNKELYPNQPEEMAHTIQCIGQFINSSQQLLHQLGFC